MKTDALLFLAVKSRVLAISKHNGQAIWSAELPGGLGGGFVTVLSDGRNVFAHTHGAVHCLDIASGKLVWSNELPGCGYGIASLCLADGRSAPDAGAVQAVIEAEQQQGAGAPAST